MTVKFGNNKTVEYIDCFTLENDFKNGITRPSMELVFDRKNITYADVEKLLGNVVALNRILLTGDVTYEQSEDGTIVEKEPETKLMEGYIISGVVKVDDDTISMKLYRLSDTEIGYNEAMDAIDALIIAMEG